jgi:hypothetical protein
METFAPSFFMKNQMEELSKGVYRHYKGNLYEVLGIAIHSESLEKMVLYKPLYESNEFPGAMWVRPLSMFLEKVMVNGIEVPRFEKTEL